MKKIRQTTADTPRASREPSMKWIAGTIYTIVFTVAALLGIAQRLARTHGGGIEAEVRGHGTARQVHVRATSSRCGRAGGVPSEKLFGKVSGNCPRVSSRKKRRTACWRLATGAGANFPSPVICRWIG